MNQESLTPDEVLDRARHLVKAKNPAAAVRLYQQFLAKYPQHKKARKELKLAQRALGGAGDRTTLPAELAKLVQLYENNQPGPAMLQAKTLCEMYPEQPMPYNVMGVLLAQREDHEAAVNSYRRALVLEPEYVDALNNLGSSLHNLGNYQEAIDCYRKVIQLADQDADALFNMGNSLMELGDYEAAADNYQASIDLQPAYAKAHLLLGDALRNQGKIGPATQSYRNALGVDPQMVDAYAKIGGIYQIMQEYDAAIPWYRDAVKLQPDYIAARQALASLLLRVGKREEAIDAFKVCLEQDPSLESARHFLNAAEYRVSDTAPRAYVTEMFDDYAPYFEQHLTTTLGYHAPEVLKQLVCEFRQGGEKFDNALDLGCGTGLSGLAFTELCESLTGVDLSNKMLEKAAEKNIYKALHNGDAIEGLDQIESQFDLIISTDMLIHIGKLEPLMEAVKERCRAGALLTADLRALRPLQGLRCTVSRIGRFFPGRLQGAGPAQGRWGVDAGWLLPAEVPRVNIRTKLKEQFPQFLPRLRRSHERLTHQESVDIAFPHQCHVVSRVYTTLGDHHAV
jgi:predicted TPR repeat methyltransferase